MHCVFFVLFVSFVVNCLPLHACRAALRERLDLLELRHRHVAGERRQQRAVRPAEVAALLPAVRPVSRP